MKMNKINSLFLRFQGEYCFGTIGLEHAPPVNTQIRQWKKAEILCITRLTPVDKKTVEVWVRQTNLVSQIECAREYLAEMLQKAYHKNDQLDEETIYNHLQYKFGLFEDTISGLLRSLTPCGKAKLDQWHTSTPAFQRAGHRLIQKIQFDE